MQSVPNNKPKPIWTKEVVTHADAVKGALQSIMARSLNPTYRWGYTWGFDRIDYFTGGVHYKEDGGGTNELTILAGRSGTGKSAAVMTTALATAEEFRQKYPDLEVRICLLEMEAKACTKRLISQLSNVSLTRLQRGFLSVQQKKAVELAAQRLEGLPITYLQRRHSTREIRDFVAAESQSGKKCGLWIVDHLGIVPTQAALQSGGTAISLGQVSGELHDIARSIAPGIVLSQLNRESLKQKDPTPSAKDLYGSDKIMQDCDNLILLYRPETFAEKTEPPKMVDLSLPDPIEDFPEMAYMIIEKQRDGVQNLKIPVAFYPNRVLWSDLSDEDYTSIQQSLESNVA